MIKIKKLVPRCYDFSTIKGLTSRQIDSHYKLYVGYINKVNEIDQLSKDYKCYLNSNTTFSKLRSIKLGESYALDGVILHQLYFENITNSNGYISDRLSRIIYRDWGNLNNFLGYLKEVCLSMRGWAIVCYEYLTDTIRISGSDLHDYGPIWTACPILIIDAYEHAYFMDFGTNKAAYIDTIFQNLNWEVISSRLDFCLCDK